MSTDPVTFRDILLWNIVTVALSMPSCRLLVRVIEGEKSETILSMQDRAVGLFFHPPAHHCVYIHQKILTYLESLETASAYPQMPNDFQVQFGLCQFAPRT